MCRSVTHARLTHTLCSFTRLAFHINAHFLFLRPHVHMRTFVLRHLRTFVYECVYSSLRFGSSSYDHQLIAIHISSSLSHINSSRSLSTHLCTQDSIHTTPHSTPNMLLIVYLQRGYTSIPHMSLCVILFHL